MQYLNKNEENFIFANKQDGLNKYDKAYQFHFTQNIYLILITINCMEIQAKGLKILKFNRNLKGNALDIFVVQKIKNNCNYLQFVEKIHLDVQLHEVYLLFQIYCLVE